MRRLALVPLLYLAACCSPATLKIAPAMDGGGTTSSGGETNGGGGTVGGGSGGGTTTGGLTLQDAGPYNVDAGKSPECKPISFPTHCTGPGDPVCGAGEICLAFGCQPADCAACGLNGQQPCPYPLTCSDGSCVAPQGGNGSAGNGSAGNGSAGNGSGGGGSGSGGSGAGGSGSGGSGAGGSGSGGSGVSGSGSGGSGAGGSGGGGSAGSTSGAGGSAGGSGGGGSAGSTGGNVQPDGGACLQDPNLQGTWNMTQDYELSQGLTAAIAGVVQAVNDIDQLMQLVGALGAPIPPWVNTLMGDLLNLQYLLSEIDVNGTLVLVNGSNSMSYTATEQWQNVTLQGPNGFSAGLTPTQEADAGGQNYFYFTSPPSYAVTTCSGIATFHQHDIDGALSGIIPPLLDAITQAATCANNGPCYNTFQQAIAAMVDCQQFTPVPDAGNGRDWGSPCNQDVDCNACAVDSLTVCNGGTCVEGCRNDYDCGTGAYCDADAGCKPAVLLTTGQTPTSGQTSGTCHSDSDCNNNQVGSGTFCYFQPDDAGVLPVNDAGQFVGSCSAGCDNNFACVQSDVCAAVGSNPIFTCLTVDTSQNQPLNQTDTGCQGPNQPDIPDAGQSKATQLCNSVEGALVGELTTFLSNLTFKLGVATVQGTCDVADAKDLTNGVWTGDILIVPISGHFQANETSTSVP